MQLVFFVLAMVYLYNKIRSPYSENFENACTSGVRVVGDVSATEENSYNTSLEPRPTKRVHVQ